MAQNFTPDWYELNYQVDPAFINAENNDNVLRSNFSGTTAPTSPIIGQQWFDIDQGPNGTMKIFDIGSSWQGMLLGGIGTGMWIATNDQQPGWVVTSNITDCVLALRGGNYGPAGGVVAGDWNITGLDVQDGQPGPIRWKGYSAGDDYAWDSGGTPFVLDGTPTTQRRGIPELITNGDGNCRDTDYYTDGASGDHDHPISHNANWRPLAAVGTLQFPDLA